MRTYELHTFFIIAVIFVRLCNNVMSFLSHSTNLFRA